jgi:site-specific DNA-methyltransferase (adenine-specific)
MNPYYAEETVTLWHARAEEILTSSDVPPANLVIMDPPYHRVVDEDWDQEHGTRSAYLAWLGEVLGLSLAKLVPAGTLAVFSHASMSWHIEGLMRERCRILNHIVWAKPPAAAGKGTPADQRAFIANSERIIVAEPKRGTGTGNDSEGAEVDAIRREVYGPLIEEVIGIYDSHGLTAR